MAYSILCEKGGKDEKILGRENCSMRILVVSDTHRNVRNLREALLQQPTAEIVIHLGDVEEDVQLLRHSFPEKMFLQVRGNCDRTGAFMKRRA